MCISITGEPVRIYKEWEIPEEWDIDGVSLEGVNVKKVGEYYYLFVAEGGPPSVYAPKKKLPEAEWQS